MPSLSVSPSPSERRRRRSPHLIQALHHQMIYVRERLSLDAIVLTDGVGEILAWAGDPELARRLGVEAPWLVATPTWDLDGALSLLWDVYPGLDARRTEIRRVDSDPFEESLVLCAVGDSPYLSGWMDHASAGVQRIASTSPI